MPPTLAPVKSPTFDKFSFVKYVKNIGRPYRKQALELISICRAFVVAQELTFHPCSELESALQLIDDALMFATEAGKQTSRMVDEAFKKATSGLSKYERKYHPEETVAERMKKAEGEDKSSLKFLNRLKENFRPPVEEPINTVEFLLHKSLPDQCPTIVRQALCRSSNLNEILWNFSHFKEKDSRLSLKQNPHFYEVLPTKPEKYGGGFRTDPIETFQYKRISVLTDNSGQGGRVYLEIGKRKRVFGNVWAPKGAIIFKDIFGALEGESFINSVIRDTPNLWCVEEPPRSHTQPSLSSTLDIPSPTMTATPTTSPTGVLIGDWKGPIRRMVSDSLDVNIRISPGSSTDFSPTGSYSTFPSPISPSGCSSSGGTQWPINIPQSRPPITIQIPASEPSTGPSTPLSYKTARSTPFSAAEPSPISPTPPFPEPHPISPSHPWVTPATSPTVLLSMSSPLQSPSVASPLAGPAIPSPTYPLPDIFWREEPQEEDVFSDDFIPSQVSFADAHTIAEIDQAEEYIRYDPSQFPDPDPEDDVSDVASVWTVTQTSYTGMRKRRWYKKWVEIIKNNLRRGTRRLPRGASASTPNLTGHGVPH